MSTDCRLVFQIADYSTEPELEHIELSKKIIRVQNVDLNVWTIFKYQYNSILSGPWCVYFQNTFNGGDSEFARVWESRQRFHKYLHHHLFRNVSRQHFHNDWLSFMPYFVRESWRISWRGMFRGEGREPLSSNDAFGPQKCVLPETRLWIENIPGADTASCKSIRTENQWKEWSFQLSGGWIVTGLFLLFDFDAQCGGECWNACF